MTPKELATIVIENERIKFNDIIGDIRTLFYTRNPEHKLCAVIQDNNGGLHICTEIEKIEVVKK